MKNVRWTKEELDSVLTAAIPLYFEKGLTYKAALTEAQQHLPEHRRRVMHSNAQSKLAKQLRVQMNAQNKKIVQTLKKVEPSKPLRDPETIELMVTPIKEAPAGSVHIQSQPVHLPIEQALQSLIAVIVNRVVEELTVQVPKALKELEHSFKVAKHCGEYAATGCAKPRVVIVGLLPAQGQMIAREFESQYSIRCVDTDKALSMSPPDADAFLLMKNFISHAVYDKYQKFSNHVLIDGGMTALRTWFHAKGGELK